MRLMSSFEICMVILTAIIVVLNLIEMNDHNHKK
jgi:hypothetical protein